MNASSQPESPSLRTTLDIVRWSAAIAVLLAGIGTFYYFDAQSQLLRVVGVLMALGAAVGAVWTTQIGKAARQFMGASRTEVRKVIWPTRQETLQTTLAVIVMVIIVGIILWLMDMVLLWAVQSLTGRGG